MEKRHQDSGDSHWEQSKWSQLESGSYSEFQKIVLPIDLQDYRKEGKYSAQYMIRAWRYVLTKR